MVTKVQEINTYKKLAEKYSAEIKMFGITYEQNESYQVKEDFWQTYINRKIHFEMPPNQTGERERGKQKTEI